MSIESLSLFPGILLHFDWIFHTNHATLLQEVCNLTLVFVWFGNLNDVYNFKIIAWIAKAMSRVR